MVLPTIGVGYRGGVGYRVSPTPYSHPALTFIGGQQNMYGWQVGVMHPTGMLYCLKMFHIDQFR